MCGGAVVVPDAEGLQVLRRTGEWEELPMMPGALVVNLGDFMEVSPSPRAPLCVQHPATRKL
jgi:isopenicillin N synthase-like dioxygenase